MYVYTMKCIYYTHTVSEKPQSFEAQDLDPRTMAYPDPKIPCKIQGSQGLGLCLHIGFLKADPTLDIQQTAGNP